MKLRCTTTPSPLHKQAACTRAHAARLNICSQAQCLLQCMAEGSAASWASQRLRVWEEEARCWGILGQRKASLKRLFLFVRLHDLHLGERASGVLRRLHA